MMARREIVRKCIQLFAVAGRDIDFRVISISRQ